VVLDEDELKMTKGNSILLAGNADDKNDDKTKFTAFLCFHLRRHAKGRPGSL
jgi:hypothetical protein